MANFAIVFSSLLFMSNDVSALVKTVAMAADVVLVVVLWTMYGLRQWHDLLAYLTLQKFLKAKVGD